MEEIKFADVISYPARVVADDYLRLALKLLLPCILLLPIIN